MEFKIIPQGKRLPDKGNNTAYFRIDYWNDYSFVTMFDVVIFDIQGKRIAPGAIKIGFQGQTTSDSTYSQIDGNFPLSEKFFSLGQGVEYYEKIYVELSKEERDSYLSAVRDIVYSKESREIALDETVFATSLLRSININTVNDQFVRILNGGAITTDYDFTFVRPTDSETAGVEMRFKVLADSKPSTNIHAIIGRNGVGKTTLLTSMVSAIMQSGKSAAQFYNNAVVARDKVGSEFFAGLISVGFSAFDPFTPPVEQPEPELGTTYHYIGLKDTSDPSGNALKPLSMLRSECVASVVECVSVHDKQDRWSSAIELLESDENFGRMNLRSILGLQGAEQRAQLESLVKRMSSGHAIVLLTISRLVEKVFEKTLVLIDEPETHLHPPLLSAFTRALSALLHSRNGIAIIATHSPVVLQEVPRSCAYIISRSRRVMKASSPRIETFGENVGTLTREVFGLEVNKSGYHSLLQSDVDSGKDYDDIVSEYNDQLGEEARGLLRAMIVIRDNVGGGE